jgi:hypothetical protein
MGLKVPGGSSMGKRKANKAHIANMGYIVSMFIISFPLLFLMIIMILMMMFLILSSLLL